MALERKKKNSVRGTEKENIKIKWPADNYNILI